MLPGMFNDIFEQHFNIKPAPKRMTNAEILKEAEEEGLDFETALEGCECQRCGAGLHSWDIEGIEKATEIYCAACMEHLDI